MSSLDNIYQKMVPTLEPAQPWPICIRSHHVQNPQAQIGRELAHDLNNILTIIQGYADRLIVKHGENPALRPDLERIADNARRAVSVVRKASPRKSGAAQAAV